MTETTRRTQRTKPQKLQLLNEMQSGGMTISILARKHGIHPVTIHRWKRDMSQETKKDSTHVHEIHQEILKLKEENNHLKKSVGNLAITNEILQTAVDVQKKISDRKN